MILIVDDSPRKYYLRLQKVLEKNDFEVDTASSGEEALKKILKKVLRPYYPDVQMPGMGTALRWPKRSSGYSKAKETAIIFLSAATANVNL